jgi:hypothetical protein
MRGPEKSARTLGGHRRTPPSAACQGPTHRRRPPRNHRAGPRLDQTRSRIGDLRSRTQGHATRGLEKPAFRLDQRARAAVSARRVTDRARATPAGRRARSLTFPDRTPAWELSRDLRRESRVGTSDSRDRSRRTVKSPDTPRDLPPRTCGAGRTGSELQGRPGKTAEGPAGGLRWVQNRKCARRHAGAGRQDKAIGLWSWLCRPGLAALPGREYAAGSPAGRRTARPRAGCPRPAGSSLAQRRFRQAGQAVRSTSSSRSAIGSEPAAAGLVPGAVDRSSGLSAFPGCRLPRLLGALFGSEGAACGRVDALVAVVPADPIARRGIPSQHLLNDTCAGSAVD